MLRIYADRVRKCVLFPSKNRESPGREFRAASLRVNEEVAMRQLFAFTLTVLTFMSCASSRVIPQPSKITLEDALASVGRSFQQFRAAEGDLRVGLIPAEVAVTFNIS